MDFQRTDSLATRASLLERLKDLDDQEGWQEFYGTYRKLIFSFALKHGMTGSEAEEVVQETVITVARNLPGFRYDPTRCAFKTWLFNLTMWRIRDQLRKRRPESEAGFSLTGDPSDQTSAVERVPAPEEEQPNAIWEQEWEKDIFERALERTKGEVPEKAFQIFDLYLLQGWQARQVARSLGVSVGRVYVTKHRISALLKKECRRLRNRDD